MYLRSVLSFRLSNSFRVMIYYDFFWGFGSWCMECFSMSGWVCSSDVFWKYFGCKEWSDNKIVLIGRGKKLISWCLIWFLCKLLCDIYVYV